MNYINFLFGALVGSSLGYILGSMITGKLIFKIKKLGPGDYIILFMMGFCFGVFLIIPMTISMIVDMGIKPIHALLLPSSWLLLLALMTCVEYEIK